MQQESPARNDVHLPANSGSLRIPLYRQNGHRVARRAGHAGCSIIFVAIVLCYLPASLFSVTQDDATHFPEVVAPGQSVTIPGKFDPTKSKTATLRIYLVGATSPIQTLTGDVTDTAITVKLPADLKPGRYYLTRTSENGIEVVEPSELRIQPKPVQLDSPHPTTAYRSPDGRFAFDIVGQNFSERAQDNQVYVSGQGPIIKSWKGASGQCEPANQPPCLSVESSDRILVSRSLTKLGAI